MLAIAKILNVAEADCDSSGIIANNDRLWIFLLANIVSIDVYCNRKRLPMILRNYGSSSIAYVSEVSHRQTVYRFLGMQASLLAFVPPTQGKSDLTLNSPSR